MLLLDGKKILIDTFSSTEYEYKIDHSIAVGEFCFIIASEIMELHPEFGINPDVCRFLGYVHDIGYSVRAEDHELETINLLKTKYLVDEIIAVKAMHGHLAEKYAIDGEINKKYLPVGLEGIILTYSDISIDPQGEDISIEGRISDILKRIKDSDLEKKNEIEFYLMNAYPRFKRYESIINNLLLE